MAADKDSFRRELLNRRDAIPPEVRRTKDRIIREQLLSLDEFSHAPLTLLFASFRSEVDTIPIIQHLLGSSRRVVLPKVDLATRGLLLFEVRAVEELLPGYRGIPEPSVTTEERRLGINDMDAAVIPGAGFDATGSRIGYGGGYYDRLLSGLRRDIPLIAVAYEEQVEESVPSEAHDRKVSIIVTDRRVIRCDKA